MKNIIENSVQESILESVFDSLEFPINILKTNITNPLDSVANVKAWIADATKVTLSGSDITAWIILSVC